MTPIAFLCYIKHIRRSKMKNTTEQDKWNKISTVSDYIHFLEDDSIDWKNLTESFIDPEVGGFWIPANIRNLPDVQDVLGQEPTIKANELNSTTMVASELKIHKDNNYGNGYDRHHPDKRFVKIAQLLGFENASVWINNQPPGALMARHVDTISCLVHEKIEEIKDEPFDCELRQPKNSKPIYRCFVALDDWHPGQIVNFEPQFWSNWKKGDVCFFHWRTTAHSTANTGWHDRPLLKITGTLQNDSWLQSEKIKVFDYND